MSLPQTYPCRTEEAVLRLHNQLPDLRRPLYSRFLQINIQLNLNHSSYSNIVVKLLSYNFTTNNLTFTHLVEMFGTPFFMNHRTTRLNQSHFFCNINLITPAKSNYPAQEAVINSPQLENCHFHPHRSHRSVSPPYYPLTARIK